MAETSAAGLRGCFQGAVHPMVLKRPTPLRPLREAASALQPPLRIRPKLQDASTLVQQPSWIVACFYCSNHRGFHPEARGRRSLPEKAREGLCLVQSQAVRERWAKLEPHALSRHWQEFTYYGDSLRSLQTCPIWAPGRFPSVFRISTWVWPSELCQHCYLRSSREKPLEFLPHIFHKVNTPFFDTGYSNFGTRFLLLSV